MSNKKLDNAIAQVEVKSLGDIGREKAKAFVRKADVAKIQERIESGAIDEAEQLLTLGTGDQIFGDYNGPAESEIDDEKNPGKTKVVTVHRLVLRDPDTWEKGPKVSILGAAQLNRQLESILRDYWIGVPVEISRGATGQNPKKPQRQMTDYFAAALTERIDPETKKTYTGVIKR